MIFFFGVSIKKNYEQQLHQGDFFHNIMHYSLIGGQVFSFHYVDLDFCSHLEVGKVFPFLLLFRKKLPALFLKSNDASLIG